jgi:hypothetical protein
MPLDKDGLVADTRLPSEILANDPYAGGCGHERGGTESGVGVWRFRVQGSSGYLEVDCILTNPVMIAHLQPGLLQGLKVCLVPASDFYKPLTHIMSSIFAARKVVFDTTISPSAQRPATAVAGGPNMRNLDSASAGFSTASQQQTARQTFPVAGNWSNVPSDRADW